MSLCQLNAAARGCGYKRCPRRSAPGVPCALVRTSVLGTGSAAAPATAARSRKAAISVIPTATPAPRLINPPRHVRAQAQVLDPGFGGKEDAKEVTRSTLIKYFGITVGSAIALAASAMYINEFSTTPCTVEHTCTAIGTGIKLGLVATHLYTFLLVPAVMFVFYNKLDALRDKGARSPFTALLGLSYIQCAIASEIGWHVTQAWYYKEEYSVLNLGFYIFLVLGLSQWAYGIRLDAPPEGSETAADGKPQAGGLRASLESAADTLLLSAPLLTGGFYLLGAGVLHTKVPIYILMAAVFGILINRFYGLLNTRWVLLFPLFSVGVNLGFIALLNKYQTDPFLNPLFHILHDAAGTELGIAIIGVLAYINLNDEVSSADNLAPSSSRLEASKLPR